MSEQQQRTSPAAMSQFAPTQEGVKRLGRPRQRMPLYGLDGLTLGERLRRARRRTGRTATRIAASLGMPMEQLSRWENDHTVPGLPAYAALAGQYGLPMDVLFWGPLEQQP